MRQERNADQISLGKLLGREGPRGTYHGYCTGDERSLQEEAGYRRCLAVHRRQENEDKASVSAKYSISSK